MADNDQHPVVDLPKVGELVGGRFRISAVLGSGGFGMVYRAVQENVGREVALKFLSPSVARDPVNIERFRREALHVSQLRHPNTITLYDYGQTEDGLFYMVMELLEGISLGEQVQQHGALSWSRAAHIFLQILKSLTEAHQRGLVHRDLKPENIHLCELFGEQDYVKVLDFGVAKMTMFDDPTDTQEKLTRAGRIFGTPMYMAPEQACAEPITTATDVYALGLMLFEMLTGLPPVTGRNRMDVIHKQIRAEVPKLTPELEDTPLGDVIRKATRKKPEERYADAAAMLEAFHGVIRQLRIVPAPSGATRPEMTSLELGVDPRAMLGQTPSPAPAHEVVPPALAQAPRRQSPPPLPAPAPMPAPKTPALKPAEQSVMTSAPSLTRASAAQIAQDAQPEPMARPVAPPELTPPSAASEEATQMTASPLDRVKAQLAQSARARPAESQRLEERSLPELPVLALHETPAETTSATRVARAPLTPDLSLIGRDRELAQLLNIIGQSVTARGGHIILMEGESGVGKTRIVQALRQELMSRHVGLAVGTFRRTDAPLEALREALADYWWVAHGDRATVAATVRADLGALAVPEEEITFLIDFLRPPREDAPPRASAAAADDHVSAQFARLERVLLLLAEHRPMVIALDDVQAADSATLSFLEYLSVTLRTQATPIVIVLTMRSGERSSNPDLEPSLRTLSANLGPALTRMRLKRLRGRELSVLLDAILPLEARLKERIAWLSQGNPHHAIQIIQYLWAEEDLTPEHDTWRLVRGTPREIDLPPDLMDLMILRVHQSIGLNSQRPSIQRVVTWVAILGIRVPVELLAEVVRRSGQMDRAQLDADLATLRHDGVIHERMHRDLICVEFDNSLLREALLRDVLRTTESRALHQLAAETKLAFYVAHGMDAPMLEVAEHWRQAGSEERYRDALYEAAQRSMRQHDPRGAREQFRELLRLLEQRGDHSAIWGQTMLALAELSRRFGELGMAEDNYRQTLDAGVLQGAELGRASRGFAHLLFVLGRYPEAIRHYRDGLSTSSAVQDQPGIAKALIGLSRAHLRQGDPAAGARVRDRLEVMLRELPPGELSGQVLLHLAEAALRQGLMSARFDYLCRALEHFKASDDRQGLSDTLVELGSHLARPGANSPERLSEGGKLLRDALEIKRAIGDRHGVAEVFKFLGFIEQELGDLEAAEHYYHQALRMHEALGAVYHIGAVYNSLGLAKMLQRDHEASARFFDEAIALFGRVGDKLASSHCMLNKGTLLLNMQAVPEARALLLQTREVKESLGSSWGLYETYNALALAAMWEGEWEEADALLLLTVERLADVDADEDRALARSLLGMLRVFQSRLQLAALELGRARGDAVDMNNPRILAMCQANTALYIGVTQAPEAATAIMAELGWRQTFASFHPEVWLELLDRMARDGLTRAPGRESLHVVRVVAHFWGLSGQTDRQAALLQLKP